MPDVAPRLLVVDDEPAVLLTLCAGLELDGFDVLSASSGVEALALLRAERVDVVLTDVRMPNMSGLDLFRAIRREHPALPVVFMTGFAVEDTLSTAVTEGVVAVLPKPFELKRTADLLTRIARRRQIVILGEADVVETVTPVIVDAGYAVSSTMTAAQLLERVRDAPTDACVVDALSGTVDLPGLVAALAAFDASVIVVALSSSSSALPHELARTRVAAWLEKPVARARLAAVLAQARASPPR